MSRMNDAGNEHEEELPPDLKALETALAGLRPRQDRLDRERLMFLTGQASATITHQPSPTVLGVRLEHRMWPAGFAAMTALAATLLGLLVTRPAIQDAREFPEAIAITGEHDHFKSGDVEPDEPVPIRRHDQTLLTVSDAYRLTIEEFFARTDALPAEQFLDSSSDPGPYDERKVLTPANWHYLLETPTKHQPSSNDSSSMPRRGRVV